MNHTITLSSEEVQLVCQALGELPLKVSLNVFLRIQQQTKVPAQPTSVTEPAAGSAGRAEEIIQAARNLQQQDIPPKAQGAATAPGTPRKK